jgi:hypothetical protein
MYKIYNDLTAKERKWKNLDKLDALTGSAPQTEEAENKEDNESK